MQRNTWEKSSFCHWWVNKKKQFAEAEAFVQKKSCMILQRSKEFNSQKKKEKPALLLCCFPVNVRGGVWWFSGDGSSRQFTSAEFHQNKQHGWHGMAEAWLIIINIITLSFIHEYMHAWHDFWLLLQLNFNLQQMPSKL